MARILIVEDEERIASFVAKGLRAEGHVTTVSADGREGLDHALSGDHDLVILDIGLPGLDGFEVAARMKADPATAAIPIIMLSAMGGRGARVIGLQSGAEEYLAKPFDPVELLARVRNLLRLREQAMEAGRHQH